MRHLPPLIGLSAERADDPAVTGAKFARLASTRDLAEIPPAWCIPAGWLGRVLGPVRLAELADLFDDLAATAGNELISLDTRLAAILANLELEADLWAALAGIADTAQPLAVRSSTLVEDGHQHSHAGIYDSFLGQRGTAQVAAAVLACWRSFYSPRAVLARLRAGDADPSPRMAVIIQHMVNAELAGVAFTQPGRTLVSAVVGTGDRLVAGTADAACCDLPAGNAPPPYDILALLAATLRQRLGHEADIEWAWNRDGFRLLQVRPVTATLSDDECHGPAFAAASLYFSDNLPPGITLGGCARLYLSVTAKRARLFRLAARHDITVDDGWIITLNGAGFASPEHRPGWWDQLTGEVVIDLGATVRQNIIQATQIPQFLTTALNLTGAPDTRHTFLLRRFIRGQAGAITRRQPDGCTAMEHSASGLLALNRGLAPAPGTLTLPAADDDNGWEQVPVPAPWPGAGLRRMASFTSQADALYPGASLEWVLHDGDPHFIDYSVTGTGPVAFTSTGITLSPGTARGPLLLLDQDTEILTRLSIAPIVSITADADVPESRYIARLIAEIDTYPAKPVIYAAMPYVILSRLIGHVAGYVFGGGSALCHLAILLREARVPAVVAPPPTATAQGQIAAIDNGAFHLTAGSQ